MGCTQSKIENEEAVARCKDRKHFMKQSVSARNAFAAAHSAYATYLKNAGAALTDFAQGEVQNPDFTSSAAAAAAAAQQTFEIPLPPPPLPDFPNPLHRAATMPEIKMTKSVGTIAEVEDEEDQDIEEEEEEEEEEARPPPPSKQRAYYPMQMQQEENAALEYFFPSAENMPGATLKDVEEIDLNKEEVEIQRKVSEEKPRRGVGIDVVDVDDGVHMVMRSERDNEVSEPAAMAMAMAASSGKKAPEVEGKRTPKQNVNLLQIFTDLDDHFLKASESAHEVSKMLEATRLHYHSNFADNRGNH